MKRKLLYTVTIFLILLGCTKDFDGIITDSFDYKFDAKNDSEGFVYEELNTSFTINPSRNIEEGKFFFEYQIEEGDGYLVNNEGEKYDGSRIDIENLVFDYAYVPTKTGKHTVLFKARDHRDNIVEAQLTYQVEYAPFTALLQGGTNSYIVNKDNDLLLIMLSENTSKELDTTYTVKYSVDGGLGTIYKDSVALDIGKDLPFSKGNSEISYIPTTLGEHTISMTCTSPDGFEKKINHSFNVDNITFFMSAEAVNNSGEIGDDVVINVVLQSTDAVEEVDYEVVYYFADDSDGVGIVKNEAGEILPAATQYPIEVGSHSYTFSSDVVGDKKMYFDISDSNNQIKRDSVNFKYSSNSFGFTANSPNESIGMNLAVPIDFGITSEDLEQDFTFSYRNKNGNGVLRDQENNPIVASSTIELEERSFTFFYTPSSMGDNDLIFTATDSFGQSKEIEINFDVNGDSFGFTIASSRDTYEITDNADITFNNTGLSDYNVTYSTSNDGILTYKGTSYSPGSTFSVGRGISLASYQAFEQGEHMLEFTLVMDNGENVSSFLDFTFRANLDVYVSIGSNLGAEPPSVGTGVDVDFNVEGTDNYTVTYSSSNRGSFSYNGNTIAPGESFTVNSGTSSGAYTGTTDGVHDLMFQFTSGTGAISESGGSINYVNDSENAGAAITIGSSGSRNGQSVGTETSVDFNIPQEGSYTATYSSSNTGEFSYNGSIIAPGESFTLVGGSSSGAYTGTAAGEHELVLELTDNNGSVSITTGTVTYEEASSSGLIFTAEAPLEAVIAGTNVIIDFNLSGNADYTTRYVNDNSGTLVYGGASIAPNQSFIIEKGASSAIYNSSQVGDHNLNFTVASSSNVNDTDSSPITIKYIEEPPADTFSAEPIAIDTVSLRTETGISLILSGSETYTATYSSDNVGTLVYNDVEVQPGDSFSISTGTTLAVYKGTEAGDHVIDFTVTSDSGQVFNDSATIIYKEPNENQIFFVEGRGLRKILNERSVINLTITGEDDHVVRFVSSEEGYILYNDTYIEQGETFPIPAGESTVVYVGTSAGIHTLDFEASPYTDFFVSYVQSTRFIYAAVRDFTFTATGESDTASIGDDVNIEFNLDQNEELFSAKYGNNNIGTLTYNGIELEPGDKFIMTNGLSTGVYNSSTEGPHKLTFILSSASDRYAYDEVELTYQSSENAINFIASSAQETAEVNNGVEIRFTLRGNETYMVTYTNDNIGNFSYNGILVAPGESFSMATGNTSGNYIGTVSGTHNLDFTVTSNTGINATSAAVIEYN